MSSRKEQGWINYYRKHFIVTCLIGLGAYWFYVPSQVPVSPHLADILKAFGALFLFAGAMGRVVASFTMASRKNSTVINTELYSVVRHPLYFFSFIMVLGVSLLTGRPDISFLVIAIFFVCFYPMMLNEEKFLQNMFGDDYTNYMKTTPRFIPKFSQWRGSEEVTINLPLVLRTLFDASVALLLIPLVEILEYLL